MSKTNGKVNNEFLRQLVEIIDNEGTHLTRHEIDIIAGYIDGNVREFTPTQAQEIERIHDKRVVNGTPDDD